MILVAAVCIAVTAIDRILTPKGLQQVGLGLGVSVAASLINLGVALTLLRVGRQKASITLEANAQHLLTDVWTSAGVLAGVGMVAMTGRNWLDPIAALLVAANIVRTGLSIVSRSIGGLMDKTLPEKQKIVKQILEKYEAEGIRYGNLRTRQAGAHGFVTVHVRAPGTWSVKEGHDLLERLERELISTLPNISVSTHLEPLEDLVRSKKASG